METESPEFVARLLDVMEQSIVPLTRKGVETGNKVFGSAILKKSDLSLIIAGTNNEIENPLWHGEVHTLKQFYELPAASRPGTKDCIFLATHEPCSLCLSAITWTGFDNFYYFFGYQDTRDTFNIPHDLKILQEVFGIENGAYARKNAFWRSSHILEVITGLNESDRQVLSERVKAIEAQYDDLSRIYQSKKGSSDIPLD